MLAGDKTLTVLAILKFGCLLMSLENQKYDVGIGRVKDSRTVFDARFQVLDSSLCSQNLDSRIQIVSGIPDSLSCSPDSISKIFPYSGIRISISWVEMVRFLPVEVSRADRSILWL